MIIAEAAGLSDVGKKRKGNEDTFLMDTKLGLYVVADGMGGRRAGEIASRLVVDTLQKTLHKLVLDENPSRMVGFDRNLSAAANQLVYSVRRANLKTYEFAQNDEQCKGMGSTVSAIFLDHDQIIVSNVGDSPIFRVRNGATETVSVIHTVMAEQDAIAPEGGLKLGQQYLHMITRAMGINETVNPDTNELNCQVGDCLVICSDGLSDKAFPEEIGELVQAHDPETACQKLVEMANERGGDDNITVVIVKIKSIEASTPPTRVVPSTAGDAKLEEPHLLVEYDTDEASYSTYSRNLRIDGIFLETSEPIAQGESLMLSITDPGSDSHLIVSGVVVGRSPKGIDIAFEDLTPDQLESLKALVRKL